MIDLSYYIKVSTSPDGCNSYDAEQFKCDRYLDCENCLEDKIIEHDKYIIEQYKDTIREIHDNEVHEIYFNAIDDFVKLAKEHKFKYNKKDISVYVIGFIEFFAEQLKQSQSHTYYSYVEMIQGKYKKGV